MIPQTLLYLDGVPGTIRHIQQQPHYQYPISDTLDDDGIKTAFVEAHRTRKFWFAYFAMGQLESKAVISPCSCRFKMRVFEKFSLGTEAETSTFFGKSYVLIHASIA